VAQTQAIYGLLSRLRAAFPHVEIESCSSGGARIDYGVLEHTQRVWLSDSNDALERLRIQHQAATFFTRHGDRQSCWSKAVPHQWTSAQYEL